MFCISGHHAMTEAPANNQGGSHVAAFLRGQSLGDFVDVLAAQSAASQKRSRPEKLVTLASTSTVGDALKVSLLCLLAKCVTGTLPQCRLADAQLSAWVEQSW